MKPVKTDYSKSSADISIEESEWRSRDQVILEYQRAASEHLIDLPVRSDCLLCGHGLENSNCFRHRRTDYAKCMHCGHVQIRALLPSGYPHSVSGTGFETVYPRLDASAYLSRRDRIYMPKLEWALSRMTEAGKSEETALKSSWLEIGCGAGYFLHALREKGVNTCHGLDENQELVATTNERCGAGSAHVSTNLCADLSASDADIIVAFFVLEHLEDANAFWRILSEKPSGTVFLFSVPMFGFSTVLEGALDGFAARNLDSAIHTQIYTDESIGYALDMAGYQKAAEWLFGQDAQDLCRLLLNRFAPFTDDRLGRDLAENLSRLIDPLQSAIDRARFCDARHILAVRS